MASKTLVVALCIIVAIVLVWMVMSWATQGMETPVLTGDPILDEQADEQAEIDNENPRSATIEQAAPGFNIENLGQIFTKGNAVATDFLNQLQNPSVPVPEPGFGGAFALSPTAAATVPTATTSTAQQISDFVAFFKTPAQMFRAFRNFRGFSIGGRPARFLSVVPSLGHGPVTVLDSVAGLDTVNKVALWAKANKPGTLVDLHQLVPIPDLVAGAASSLTLISLGNCVFARCAGGWRYRGPLERLWMGERRRWDLYPDREIGYMRKAAYETCPFPNNVCGAVWTWAANGRTGNLTFADGAHYNFDGRFITEL